MHFSASRSAILGAGLLALQACGSNTNTSSSVIEGFGERGVPEFGDAESRRLSVIATAANGLQTPRDLEFNPLVDGELWVVNRDTEGVVIFHDAGTTSQRAETRTDSYRGHFMARVSSLAFGTLEDFASCQESVNGGNDFMGPTLWSSDLDIFANVNQDIVEGATCTPFPRQNLGGPSPLLGSHIDMLHQSPNCMGIAYATGNAFWTFDGANGNLVYYDFVRDHGPGNDDHSDGRLRRYTDVAVRRVAGVPSHMVVDSASGALFIADTGTGRVLKVDASTATSAGALRATNEPLAEYLQYTGATVTAFASGLSQPSGIAISGDRLFVGDHASGQIVAYSISGGTELERITTGAEELMGLAIDPAGALWYVDGGADTLVRVETE